MPSEFIQVVIPSDADALAQLSFDKMGQFFETWEPSDGQLDSSIISAISPIAADLAETASSVPASIFRYFGASLANIPPLADTYAQVLATVTVDNVTGYTFPAGSIVVGIRDSAGILRGFQNSLPIVIPSGSTSIAGQLFVATEIGADSNALGGASTTMELQTANAHITSVVTASATQGGADAEDDDVYLARLAEELTLQAPRPIIPSDFAIFSKNIAGVGRALAIDGYDAVALTSGNARTITVAVADVNGLVVGSTIKAAVQAALQAAREVNFLVYVIDPTYTTIDVTWNVKAYPGFTSQGVTDNVNAALQSFLNPATWGSSPYTLDDWLQQTVVAINDLKVVIGNADGVRSVNSVTIRTGAGSYAATDITMTGAAPLPLAGASVGTVV